MNALRIIAALLALVVYLPGAADAGPPVRIAVLVGNNVGADNRKPLRYAETDTQRVKQALVEVAGFDADNIFLANGFDSASLEKTLVKVKRRIEKEGADRKGRTLVLFYFSGHSDGKNLEMGSGKLPFSAIKSWLSGSGATVKMAVLDACHSGGFSEVKGGRPGPSFDISISGNMNTAGMAVITSSSSGEKSQESDDVGGSYFTHHFVSGLYGAADLNSDMRVTLQEVYAYAYGQTISQTLGTVIGPQHPTYNYDLEGKGDLVLSMATARVGHIEIPALLEGRFYVFKSNSGELMAEVVKSAGRPRYLIVAPGDYLVARRDGDRVFSQKLSVSRGETVAARADEFDEEETALAWPKGRIHRPANTLAAFYSLSGWMMNQMGSVHGFGLGLTRRMGPITALADFGYGQTTVNDEGLVYSYRAYNLAVAPMWRFELPGFDLLLGITAGGRVMTQDAGTAGSYSAPSAMAGLIGGVDLSIGEKFSMLMTWEMDADLFELNDSLAFAFSPRAKLGMGYRF